MKKAGGLLSVLAAIAAFGFHIICGKEAIEIVSVLCMLAFLLLLICEVLPVTLSCLLALGIMPLIGVTDNFNAALSGFSNQVVFFILASFGMALALAKVPLSKRFLKFMLQHFGKDSRYFVLAFMICTALISSVISNVPACAVFLSVALAFLELYSEKDRRKTGKTLMIGIPIASMIGGIMTPAGSSINLLAISLLEEYTGETITFVQWMCIGIPVAVLILPLAWFWLTKLFPPAELENKQLNEFIAGLPIPEKLLNEEKRVLLISGTMLILWILSSWFAGINVMLVALLGCCAFCMPGFGVLDIDEFMKNVSWDAFFLVGTVLSMGNMLVKNGVSGMMIQLLPDLSLLPTVVCLIFIALCTFALLIVIPVAPSLVTFMAPVVIAIAAEVGINPAISVIICAVCACNCYLFPLDTVCLLTYSKGYYKMSDMAKVTALIQICISIIVSVIGIGMGYFFGWI